VTTEQLTAVHPAGYVEEIRSVCESGGGAFDPDTVASAGS
jgi:acetoin utilization deacetylase AcuC-like enzyme